MSKFYECHGKATDKNGEVHRVVVVGEFKKEKLIAEGEEKIDEYTTIVTKTPMTDRNLTFGYAICHPTDEFNLEKGIKLAKKRCKSDPNGVLHSTNVTMLTKDACEFYVFHKLVYIIQHIDEFIERRKKNR